ncbi:MAG: flagellar hook-associated protein FlgK, partial [Alphaproteobacteria bacterium]|nr:flagellar hook-associated protein FlgK [Alphaproteobacteria bacterium]
TSARFGVLSAGQSMAQALNGMTSNIQGLRSQAELQISDTVTQANNDMSQIAALNEQLGQMDTKDATFATLEDKRDGYIDDLSTLMNITVTPTDNNKVNIFTGSGTQLVGDKAVLLKFDAQGSLTPESVWSADPTKRGVGTITIDQGNNLPGLDLIANGFIKSGKLAALLQMRDTVLTQAQGQIDQIAGAVSSALSDQTVQGTAVTSAGQNGFDIDLGTLQDGNTVNITYTDSGGASHNLTIMRVNDPSVLPLPQTATADANDQVVGVNFANGMPSVLTQIQNALGTSGVRFYNPSGTTLRVLDDGAGGQVKVNSVTSTSTITSLQSGNAQLPFFLDGSSPYTGAITNAGPQSLGLAGRIQINPALMSDPTKLVAYQATTDNADATRPNYILNQLTAAVRIYAPQAGVGSVKAPFSGTISSYLQQMLSQQGQDASNANNLNQGQQVVVNSLQQKFNSESGVNIDAEMANLLQLQTTYSANARVMTTIKDMINTLLQM